MNLTSPKNWKTVPVGDIMNIFTGKKDVNQTVPDGEFMFFSCSPETFRSSEYICDDEALIIAGNGSYTGTVRFYKGKFDLYQRAYGCTIKDELKDKYDIKFIFYQFKKCFERDYMGGSRGSSIPYIVRGDISNYELRFPESLDDQREIAAILGSLDDKIELLRRENKTLESIAQALFKEWFVEFKFPGYENLKMVDGVPEGWKVGKLGDVAFVTKGTTPTTIGGKFVDSGINFIKAESITEQHGFLLNKFSFIDEHTNSLLNRSVIQAEDLLYTIAGTIGRFALITKDLTPANTNQAVAIIRANQEIVDPYYFRCYFDIESIKENLTGSVVEAVQANLSLGSIKDCEILIPDKEGMSLFIEKIKPLFLKIDLHNIEIQTLSRLRDDLLNKIFNV